MEVTAMQFTADAMVEDVQVTFHVLQARREPTLGFAQEQLHAATEAHRHRVTAQLVAQITVCVYTTVPAALATMLLATALQTNVHAIIMSNVQSEIQEQTTSNAKRIIRL